MLEHGVEDIAFTCEMPPKGRYITRRFPVPAIWSNRLHFDAVECPGVEEVGVIGEGSPKEAYIAAGPFEHVGRLAGDRPLDVHELERFWFAARAWDASSSFESRLQIDLAVPVSWIDLEGPNGGCFGVLAWAEPAADQEPFGNDFKGLALNHWWLFADLGRPKEEPGVGDAPGALGENSPKVVVLVVSVLVDEILHLKLDIAKTAAGHQQFDRGANDDGGLGIDNVPWIAALRILVGIPVACVMIVKGNDARSLKRQVLPHQILDLTELCGLPCKQYDVDVVLDESVAIIQTELVEDLKDDFFEGVGVVAESQILTEVEGAAAELLVDDPLERNEDVVGNDGGVRV